MSLAAWVAEVARRSCFLLGSCIGHLTFRFILGNIQDKFTKQNFENVKIENFSELERYTLNRLYSVNQSVKEDLKNYNFHRIYKTLLNFCNLDLSSFYFDIRKDVLYCDDVSSKKRKDCVLVLNLILDCLLKWFAPILVFTTEEIFQLLTDSKESIHESSFASIPKTWENSELDEKWKALYKIKQDANIAIEQMRSNKKIGSSLEADIEINTNSHDYKILESLDLAEYFITSKAKIIKNSNDKDPTSIFVRKAKGIKCPRCWKIVEKNCSRCEKIN